MQQIPAKNAERCLKYAKDVHNRHKKFYFGKRNGSIFER